MVDRFRPLPLSRAALMFVGLLFAPSVHAQAVSPAPDSVVTSEADSTPASLPSASDARFRNRMLSWSAPAAIAEPSGPVAMPVPNFRLSSGFGIRTDPLRHVPETHAGVDMPDIAGTPVRASADGIVERAGSAGGYGNLIEIDHGGGVETRYGHLSRLLVSPDAVVKRGQIIALMGSTGRSTGSHLHFEVRLRGRPVDPLPYLEGNRSIGMRLSPPQAPIVSAFARALQ